MNLAKISLTLLRTYGHKVIEPASTSTVVCGRRRSASTYKGYDLKNYRSLVSVKGADASVFLQNIITDDIYKLRATATKKDDTHDDKTPTPRSLYAMVLNSRGRIMYDVLVHLIDDITTAEREYFVEVDSSAINDFIGKLLEPLKLRKKVRIQKIDADFKLFALVDSMANMVQDNKKLVASKEVILLEPDPRYSRLGYRAIIKTKDANAKASFYINNVVDEDNIKTYKEWFYKNGVAENRENITTTGIPLEFNLVYLNGVSFDKGCYLGQELIAKTHHTGVIRKRVMPIHLQLNPESLDKEGKIAVGSEIKSVRSGKTVGKLINYSGQYGIAMMRLENVDKGTLYLFDNDKEKIMLTTQIPKYWRLDDDPNIKALSEVLSK